MAVLGPRSKDVCAGGSEGTRTPKPQPIFKGDRTGRIMLLTSIASASGCRRLTPVFGAACTGVVLVDLDWEFGTGRAGPFPPRIHRRIHRLWMEHVYDWHHARHTPTQGGGVTGSQRDQPRRRAP